MAGINDEKLKMMEDEMNRFEAEIALPVMPPPPPPPLMTSSPRAVIGSNTYNQVQRRLEEQQTIPPMPDFPGGPPMGFPPMLPPVSAFAGIPPPPPPPPPLLIPHQVQRGPPMRHPMRPMGPPGPMMPGPPPPPPPGFMGPPHPPHVNHRPGPPFMGPPVHMERLPAPMQPPPPAVTQPQIPAIVSATPKIYMSKSHSGKTVLGDSSLQAVTPNDPYDDASERKRKKQKLIQNTEKMEEFNRAKEMAERVKATTIVSVGPVGATPVAVEDPPITSRKKEKKNKKLIRMAGGQTWEDNSLSEWEDDDFRIFCGDLGNDVTDEILTRAFSKYQSFLKAKVVRDKRSNKTKGFGFVSFKDPQDFIKAMKEMNGRYVGSRPIKLRKSTWRSRNLDTVRKKEKEKTALIGLLTGR